MLGVNVTHESRIQALPLRAAILGILGMHLGSGAALAQEIDESGTDGSVLQEITVTATRFSEAISKVPISMSAYDTKSLDVANVKDFSGIAQMTPGVSFNNTNNTIAIRGISSTAGAATTGVYVDDTPIHIRQFGTSAAAGLPRIFDLERVEVLRGPQGTLYGAGSQGGTVRFITPQPNLVNYETYARGEVAFTEGGEPSYESGIAFGGPIVTDKLGFRLSAYNRRDGGWTDHIDYNTGNVIDENANWGNVYAFRGALTWMPVEGLYITPSVLHQDVKENDTSIVTQAWSAFGQGVFRNANPIRLPNTDRYTLPSLKVEYQGDKILIVSNTSYFKRDQTMFYDASLWRLANLQLNFGFPLVTPYGPDDEVGVTDFESPGRIINAQDNITQELRFQSADPDARLTWVVGAYYGKSKQRNVERGESDDYDRLYLKLFGQTIEERFGYPMFEGIYSFITDTRVQEEQIALFGDATWKVTDTLSIAAGVRAAENKFEFVAGRAGMTQATWTYNGGGAKERPISPRLNVTYRPTDDFMVYSTAAKGFRTGGANSSSIINQCAPEIASLGLGNIASYDSDTVWSYDLGVKGKALDGRMSYDMGVYRVDWDDIQQSNFLVGCGLSYIGNFGKARSQGVDVTLQAAPTPDLLVDLTIGYVEAEYLERVMSSPSPNASILINKGNSLPNITPWKLALALTYNFDVLGNEGYIRGQYEYGARRSDMMPTQDPTTSQYNAAVPFVPENHMVRLRAGVDLGNLDVSVFANNLLNSAPLLSRSAYGNSQYFMVSTWRPRTYGVTLVYRY